MIPVTMYIFEVIRIWSWKEITQLIRQIEIKD